MKQKKWIFLLPMVLLLSACQMPFVTAEKEVVSEYVDTKAELVASSLDVDKQLQENIEDEKKFNAPYLINEVRQAKKVQESILKRIENEEAPFGRGEIKKIYIDVVSSHIDSYNQYESALDKKNKELLLSTLSKHQIKQEKLLNNSLLEMNHILKDLRIDERETLLPIEKKTEKKTEKKSKK